MKMIHKFWAVCVTVLIASVCVAEDWNQFRGPQRDGKSTETGLLQSWQEGGPPMLWHFEGLGRGFSTVSIVDGVIYTTGMIDERGYLFAINTDGELKWKKEYGPEWTENYPGTRTTPTIDGNRIYIMSGHGRLACFDKDSSDLIWQVDTLEQFNGETIRWGITESVLVEGEQVICTPGGKNATMVSFNKHTGEVLWKTEALSNLSAYCSPLLVPVGEKRLLFTMVRDLFVCINAANGEVMFTIPHETRNNIAAITPALCSGNRIYYSSHGRGGKMIQIKDGGKSYEELWKSRELPVLHGGVVVLDDPEIGHRIFGADERSSWVNQDVETGEVVFKERLLNGKGSITYADGMLYCYSEEGLLGLVKPSKDKLELVSSFEITMGADQHWAYPVIHDGRMYIRHGDVLMAFDIREG